jgi:K+-transporting ATPase ATPase C chain
MKTMFCGLRVFIFLSVITGLVYPLLVTLVGQAIFPRQASGDFLSKNGKLIGSRSIGQKFVSEKYFWGRPSSGDYNPIPSGATNLGPTSAALKKSFAERKTVVGDSPQDLLFASGSGLDPEISPAAALFQVDRVARARGVSDRQRLIRLIEKNQKGPDMGFLGEPRVNVLELNLALDEETGR